MVKMVKSLPFKKFLKMVKSNVSHHQTFDFVIQICDVGQHIYNEIRDPKKRTVNYQYIKQ